jgi:hypothetical protein
LAADLERTLIAARYSSRDLSKLLHGLFPPPGEPLVVVQGARSATPAPNKSPPEPLPPTDRMRPVRRGPGEVLGGALRAERARLVWEPWRERGKIALAAVAVGAAIGMMVLAVREYGPMLLGTEPPAPAAAEPLHGPTSATVSPSSLTATPVPAPQEMTRRRAPLNRRPP